MEDKRVEAILDHVADTVIVIPNHELNFEQAGPRLPIEDLPAGHTLVIAAYFYSLVTGDFAVSLGDLMDGGFWPYDVYDAKYRDYYLYETGFIRNGILSSHPDDPEWLEAITADSSLYDARRDILNDFYREYLEANRNDIDVALAALKPLDAFWQINELRNESGDPIGSIQDEPVSRFLYESSHAHRTPPQNDPYNKVMVPFLAPSDGRWPQGRSVNSFSTSSGYSSVYRAQTRAHDRDEPSDAPSKRPGTPGG